MATIDFIVIGGGMAGVGAAAALSASSKVVLLEAEPQLGYHATGRSAAIYIRNYGNETLRALNALSAEVFDAASGPFDGPLLSPRGELLLVGPDDLRDADAYSEGAEGLEHLTPAQARDLVPVLRPEGIHHALYESSAQDIDVGRMLQGYTRALRQSRGGIHTNAKVRGLKRRGGLWDVSTDESVFTAPVVINAAGAWAAQVAALAGALPVPLTPCRRSAALIPAPEGHDVTHWPVFGSVAETWYAKPDAGRLMVSPADADPVAPQDAWPDDMVLAEGLDRFERAVTVPVTRVEHRWAGLRTFSPDKSPVVGFDPKAQGFFWLAGQGGYGIQTAPALSMLTAALCLGEVPRAGASIVKALAPDRFGPAP